MRPCGAVSCLYVRWDRRRTRGHESSVVKGGHEGQKILTNGCLVVSVTVRPFDLLSQPGCAGRPVFFLECSVQESAEISAGATLCCAKQPTLLS